ncbi:LLM class flavin-dependent oxidoreductase [Micromonospora sp. NBC_01412]|uniref:LLM class flavin-dependent oxidoreductase n=1 Tax=Micromonospora sp. NBC_01412 TaxID=2903590 RepID=UPI00324BF4BD
MEIAVSHLPTDPARALEIARLAEEVGIGTFGVADSSHLYGAMYPVAQHILAHTRTIRVGPCVTNPVTRHPSVHAADVAALNGLFPDRVFVAMGTGDSAVHSVGLRPADPGQVGEALDTIRAAAGPGPQLFLTASGPRAAAATPGSADGVLLGGGFEPGWLGRLATTAAEAAGRRQRGWMIAVAHLVERDSEVAAARQAVRASVIAVARHGLGVNLAGRGVPADLVPGLRELFSRYVFAEHARPDGANARTLADYPREEAYLLDRFALVGTPGEAAERLRVVEEKTDIEGIVLTTTVPDPMTHVALIGRLVQGGRA